MFSNPILRPDTTERGHGSIQEFLYSYPHGLIQGKYLVLFSSRVVCSRIGGLWCLFFFIDPMVRARLPAGTEFAVPRADWQKRTCRVRGGSLGRGTRCREC